MRIMLSAAVFMSMPEFIDSKDNPEITYVVINNCAVPIQKKELKEDLNKVVEKVMEICK